MVSLHWNYLKKYLWLVVYAFQMKYHHQKKFHYKLSLLKLAHAEIEFLCQRLKVLLWVFCSIFNIFNVQRVCNNIPLDVKIVSNLIIIGMVFCC